jgi:putative SOS response-associated peptidase YedK
MKDESLFGFAGLWERWKAPHGEKIETFTIITGEPNDLIRPLHDRMPVIIAPEDFDTWLGGSPEEAQDLLKPFPSERMDTYPISTRINTPANDDADCIAPIEKVPTLV